MNYFYKLTLALLIIGKQGFSQVTVTGVTTATYSTVNAAFTAINAGSHTGAITIDITGNTSEPNTPVALVASGIGSASYSSIILRPTVTATISGASIVGRGVLEFDGADNVTIDGDVVGGAITRNLTIMNSAAATTSLSAAIRLLGTTTGGMGATNNTIKNCVIMGNTEGNNGSSGSTVATSFGIYAGVGTGLITATGTGADYDNLTIQNNEVKRAYFGIYIGAATANTADNLNINNNLIGSNTVGQTTTLGGMNLNGVTTSTVSQNEILNQVASTSISPYGIQVTGAGSNSVILSRNHIHGIKSISTSGYGAYGISIAGGNNHTIINNVIYDIITVNYLSTSTLNAMGIRLSSGTGHKVYYNSVNLFGMLNLSTTTSTSAASAALAVTATGVTSLDIRNNILCNTQTSTLTAVTTKRFMAIWFPAAYDFANATLNNNSYNVSNDADHFVGKVGTTNNVNEASSLIDWRLLSQVNNAANDVNSIPVVNIAAPYTSNTNLTIPANTLYAAESGAVLIPALGTNTDYNAAVRPLAGSNPNTNPDMGAYEFDGVSAISTDAGPVSVISPASTGCYGSSESVVISLKNYGSSPVSNIPVTVTVSGSATQTFNATYSQTIAPNATVNFTVGTLNMLATGNYTFNGTTSLAGDLNSSNNTLPSTVRTVVAPSALPQFVDFTGFTGANLTTFFPDWREGDGTLPIGVTSAWTSQTNMGVTGNVTARVLLSTAANTEWIVGPKISASAQTILTFDAALTGNTTMPFTPDAMGSDDKVRVMVSSDCGLSYTPVFTISASDNLGTALTNFSVSLAAFAGQDIIVGFLATDGPIDDIESYYFHLDNINLYDMIPADAGLLNMLTPGLTCYSATEQVVVTIKNNGTAPISNIPVNVSVSGAVTQNLSATFTGSIAVGANATFTVGTINMTTPGTYSFTGSTALSGDINVQNDDMPAYTRTVLPLAFTPQVVSFTGFTGTNLTTFFPNWREGTGASFPQTNASAWTSQTNFNSAGNVNARLLLSATSQEEWIVGPRITANATTNLSFDAALTNNTTSPFTPDSMGRDDVFQVMISTDCGNSFAPFYAITFLDSLTPTFENFNLSLGMYAGQDIIVAFMAKDGPIDDVESYYFHLDNINLYNASPTDAGVSAILTPTPACYGAAESVEVTLSNFGTADISNVPVVVKVTGAATQSITATYTGTLAVGASASFTVGTVNLSAAGQYNIRSYTTLSGDVNHINDSSMVERTTLPLGTLPQSVGFTGFSGANLSTFFPSWREGDGTNAIGTTSSWTSQTNLGTPGNVNARMYLSATANTEWIVGPKFTATSSTEISFDAALTGNIVLPFTPDSMGSDDKVSVMVSTDCGNTYSPVFSIVRTNSLTPTFTNFVVPLGAYAGQNIVVAFLAQDGPVDDPETYYVHLDNINLYNISTVDAGITALANPVQNTCYTANETVAVSIKNHGSAPLSNIPVTVTVSGPYTATLSGTYSGTIAPGATATYTIGTTNMSTGGVYSFTSTTNISGDPNGFNNTSVTTITANPVVSIAGRRDLCTGGSGTLTAVGAATSYTWSTGDNTSSIVISPTAATFYTLTASNGTCTSILSTSVSVSNPTIAATGNTVCANVTSTLNASGFTNNIKWFASPTATTALASGASYTLSAPATTTVYAEARSFTPDSLFTNTSGTSAFIGEMFDIVAVNDIEVTGFDVQFSAGSGVVEVWYRPGTHVGFSTSNAGWTLATTATLTSNGTGQLTRIPSSILVPMAAGQSYGFYVVCTSGLDVRYSTGTAVGNIYAQNGDLKLLEGTTGDVYFNATTTPRAFNGQVKYNRIACTSPRVPVTLSVLAQPTLALTASQMSVCPGSSVTLNVSGATTYTWSTGSNSTSVVVTPTVATGYNVVGTNTLGCNTTSLITIGTYTLPVVSIITSANTICAGANAVLTAGGGVTYLWNTVSTSSMITVSPTVTTTYSVTGTSAQGCSKTAVFTQSVSACTGIESLVSSGDAIRLYPNPSNGLMTMEFGFEGEKIITITNAIGQVIRQLKTTNTLQTLDLSAEAKGIYLVKVESRGYASDYRVSVQ